MKTQVKDQTINIRIRIKEDEYLKQFIFKNINYRRKVWNDFVEEANKHIGEYHMYYDFKPLDFKTKYFNEIEEPQNLYEEYCLGISEQVSKDINRSIKMIRTKNKKVFNKETVNKLGTLKFHKRDNYCGSFKVHCKNMINRHGNYQSRLFIIDDKTLQFRVRGWCYDNREYITINLYESLFKESINGELYNTYIRPYHIDNEYRFTDLDIQEISFIHNMGKFYIQLSVTGRYIIDMQDRPSKKSKIRKAGIDTGIHNPICIYDGKDHLVIEMPQKVSNKIHYLERRAKRLQHVMDKKMGINKKKYQKGEIQNIYTNNYEKVRKKFRKIWKKISNIKRHWVFNISKKIVTLYDIICVDVFVQPGHIMKETLPRSVLRHINYTNRFHCMFLFNETLKYMANKYGCEYIESPENTTCTCSKCGAKMPHLPLSQRKFTCTKCRFSIDRDFNASKNCYMYI